MGKIRLSQPVAGGAPRLELLFETENMSCALGVPTDRFDQLKATYNGECYTHHLPGGDRVWLPLATGELPQKTFTPPMESIETFPLPSNSRLMGPGDAENLKGASIADLKHSLAVAKKPGTRSPLKSSR